MIEEISTGRRIVGFIAGWRFMACAGIVLAMFAAFTAWTVRGWKADSDLAALVQAHADDREGMRAAADAELQQSDREGRAASAAAATEQQTINSGSDRVKREISNAQNKAAARGDVGCLLNPEWVRLYNEALQPDRAPDPAAREPAGEARGAGEAGGLAANEWDVQHVHAENARRWAVCRSTLNRLIDFETAPEKRGEGGDKPPVVTASPRH